MNHAERLARAASSLRESGLGGLLVGPSPDLVYLTGYAAPPLERLTMLAVRAEADPVLLVPELELPRALGSPAGELLAIVSWADGDDPYEAASRLLRPRARLAVGDRLWSSHLLELQRTVPEARFEPSSRALPLLRAIKDDDELELLRRAARGADAAFAGIVDVAFEGRSELDLARDLEALLREHHHEEVNFTIVGSGPNGASPHHDPGERRIERGESVVMDFGGRVGGYCSDITRTVVVGGPPEEFDDVYEVVQRAQEAAFRAVRPRVAAQDVDRVAREIIDGAGYGRAFVHRTGHGIGLEEHEPPYIVAGNADPLEPGMCFSIEPGVYLAGRFGVRIEDIVAVTEGGAERLNEAPRELVRVG